VSFTLDEFEDWTNEAEDESDFYWDDLNNNWKTYDSPFGQVVWVTTESEYDEGRQNLEMIFTVGGDRFFQKTGYYDSWAGGAWDGALIEVRPREKMITVYDAI
jgi:hypothetical protein